jgi:hypothetical protein
MSALSFGICAGDSGEELSEGVSLPAATHEEVAYWLSVSEGRPMSIQDVRRIETQALRKLRAEFARRGLGVKDLAPR